MSDARYFKTTLYALLIFLAGAVSGAFVAPMIGRTFMQPPKPEQLSHHMLADMQARLKLTDQQVAQIRPLMKKTGQELETIRNETMKRVRTQLDATDAQISALLTPDQQAEFAKMVKEHRARHRREHVHGPPQGEPPPPPPDR